MKAYKFRSSQQMQFAFDIILSNRLYCSDWKQLNDPMEGAFVYSRNTNNPTDDSERVIRIATEKKKLKICSLAKSFDCHLLWVHYASGFDGLAIEVELPDDDLKIRKVEYRGVFAFLQENELNNPDTAATKIFSSKYKEWSYEHEIRIIQEENYYHLEKPIRRIIAGSRMNPALFNALKIICKAKKIELCSLGIGDEGLDADFVDMSDIIFL